MVTARKVFKADSYYMEYRGLHADPKPANAKEGDVFKELDTDSVYKFEGGKWVFSPGGAGGEGLSDGIDIIGTDKELKDLSGIAVGFDLPDIPGEPDVTVSKTVTLAAVLRTHMAQTYRRTAGLDGRVAAVFESPLPFDLGTDINDLSIYGNPEPLFFSKMVKADVYFDGDTAYSGTFIGAYCDHAKNPEYSAEFLNINEVGVDFMYFRYIPPQENYEGPFGLYVLMTDSPAGVNEVTITLTQEGTPAVTGRVSEIAAKYIESPEVEKGLKFNALKEVGVGYVKEGDKITVVNDGTGDTTTIESLSMRKVSDVFPFDISGETEESHGGTFIKLDMPITVELSNPAIAQEAGNSIPYIASYPASMTGGVAVYVGVASPEALKKPFFFYAENDVELPTGTILKGLWVIDMTTPANVAITSLTQGDPDTIHKIDAKYLDIPPVINGEGTTGLENFSKIAVGGLKGLDFAYVEGNPYDVIESPYTKLIKIAEFDEIDLENENEELTHPISYRYFVNLNGTEQEVSGEFDTVAFENGVYHIYDGDASGTAANIISLTATQSEISEMGITIPSGVWSMFASEGEEQLIPLKISQTEVVKIPANYIDGAGYDATFVLGPGRASIEVYSHEFDFDSLVDKLNADEPLNVKVDFAGAGGISSGYSPLAVTRISVNNLDAYVIDIYVDSSNNSLKEEYYQDFPGYVSIYSNSNVRWVASPEDISIKFSVAGSGSYNMIASGTYNQLYNLVSTGKMPSVKAYIAAYNGEQQN